MEFSGNPSQKPSNNNMENKKKVIWESSDEEEGVDLGDDSLKKLMGAPVTTAAREKKEKEEAALNSSGLRVERDIFGRVSAKHRSAWKYRKQSYGTNYNIMSGEEVPSIHGKVIQKSEGSPAVVEYITDMYDGKGNRLNPSGTGPETILSVPEDYWKLATPSEQISRLSTFQIQSTLCAAINSRSKLVWLFGVSSDFSTIEGCYFAEGRFDTFIQGLEYALTHEFFPALDPSLVKITVFPIEHPFSDECHVIKMSLDSTMSTLYQLSSGRVFYRCNDIPILIPSLNEARSLLLERRRAEIDRKKENGEKRMILLPKSIVAGFKDDSLSRHFLTGAIAFGAVLGFFLG